MLKHFISVSGFTLLSRMTGLLRDLVTAAVLGAGLLADAFFVALRLPNHFRAIFGEGAFNAAFVPIFTRLHETGGVQEARRFADNIWTIMVLIQVSIFCCAMLFMTQIVKLLAPGFSDDPEKLALAITLTRITFPYLFFITLVTLVSGMLNGVGRFAAAASAPILLNISIVAALGLAFLFPSAGHAAAWAVVIAGSLELLLVYTDSYRIGLAPRLTRPRLDGEMRLFLKTLVPAVIGSAGVQIALFADTIIASMLPTGAVSSVYYADRLYQLPIGVIAIAAGTVLLPQMSRLVASHQPHVAHERQNRTLILSLALSAPCMVAFLMMPDLIISALFGRGAFTAQDAQAAGHVLAAYAIGLPAIVMIPSLVASFRARLDTITPAIISLIGISINVALKIVLTDHWSAAGLALATAAGAWVNCCLLYGLALYRQWTMPDKMLTKSTLSIIFAGIIFAIIVHLMSQYVPGIDTFPRLQDIARLVIWGGSGGIAYVIILLTFLRLLRVPFLMRKS